MEKKPLAVLVTDLHLKESNQEENFKVYKEAARIAKDFSIPILNGGDIFDSRKSQPQQNLLAFEYILVDLLKGVEMYCIVGNHDKVDQSQKGSFLTPFKEHKNFHLIDTFGVLPLQDLDIYFLSFFTDEVFQEYLHEISLMLDNRRKVLLTHIDIKGFSMNSTTLSEHGFETDVFTLFDKVIVGHYHDNSEKKNIEFIGATLQHNFGESETKGIRILYDDLTTEIVYLTDKVSSYKTIKVSTPEELYSIKIEGGGKHRVVFSGKREDILPAISTKDKKVQELLSKVKLELKYKEDIHSIKEVESNLLDSTSIKLHFKDWCNDSSLSEEEYNYGLSLLNENI